MEYWAGLNEEWFTSGPYDSREEAIAKAPSDMGIVNGDFFYTCVASYTDGIEFAPGSEYTIEVAQDAAYDQAEDLSEGWLEILPIETIKDLDTRLRYAWGQWLKAHHLTPTWWFAIDVQCHEFCGQNTSWYICSKPEGCDKAFEDPRFFKWCDIRPTWWERQTSTYVCERVEGCTI